MNAARHACILFLWLGGLLAGAASAAEAPASQPSWERYRILVERNIFSRDRGRRVRRAPATRPSAPATAPKPAIVLRGISRRGAEYVAFFEDSRSARTTGVSLGGIVDGARVTRITLDEVELAKDGRTVRVAVGRSLDGASAPASAPVAARAPAKKPGTADANTLSILERLRQRRRQELQKK